MKPGDAMRGAVPKFVQESSHGLRALPAALYRAPPAR
jgi:hypothetical protein